jgi:hypothetical protein
MLPKTEATIYLANQRGCSQNDWYRSYHTFNFGLYFNESKKPFGSLHALNDDTLKGGSTLKFESKEDSLILLLPVVGTLNYKNNLEIGKVEVGQAYHFFAPKDSEFEIFNTYENELINFLQVRIAVYSSEPKNNFGKSEFNFDADKNKLISLPSSGEDSIHNYTLTSIGKFDGRKEETYSLRNSDKGIFIFILEGAFEVENRLLQPRDGLALWNLKEIKFEALSNNAIILMIESQ